ncbi:MAG: hypothetical protein ACLFNO_02825 [Parcubacteria group bacterium]
MKNQELIGKELLLTVNYSYNLKKVITPRAYSWSDEKINTSNFSPPFYKPNKERIIMKLFHYKKPVSTKKAAKDIVKSGFNLANLYELIALGKKYPNLQHEFAVFALGSQILYGANSVQFPVLIFGVDTKYQGYYPTPETKARGIMLFNASIYSYTCLYAGVKIKK